MVNKRGMRQLRCRLCGCGKVSVTYQGPIRDGKVGNLYKDTVSMYRCERCGTIWHENLQEDYETFYESEDYRQSLEGTSSIADFYRMHDAESLAKFHYTGTEIFRGKVVADIGCGGGAFLDYVNTVAQGVIAVEPSQTYRKAMAEKGFTAFPYVSDAQREYAGKIDVLISFDVIEHVQDPLKFVEEAHSLLRSGGSAFIGTPTDAPVMRELLGKDYESFLFSTQHPWVLSKGSFLWIAEQCGIKDYRCKFYQRYGMGNLLYWLLNREPGQHRQYDFISRGLDEHWRSDLEDRELSDYIVFEFVKH